jgi:hypothetical protein
MKVAFARPRPATISAGAYPVPAGPQREPVAGDQGDLLRRLKGARGGGGRWFRSGGHRAERADRGAEGHSGDQEWSAPGQLR